MENVSDESKPRRRSRGAGFGILHAIALAGSIALVPGECRAGYSFVVPDNTSNNDGNAVAGRVTFTPGTNSLTIVVENLEANPTASNQFISGIQFTLSGSPTGQTFSSGSGQEMNLNQPDYTFVNGGSPVSTTRWHLGGANELTALGGGQPSELIVGPPDQNNKYSNANGGAGNFNPNIYESATFTLTYTGGVGAATTISNVKFEFGTNPSEDGIIPAVQASVPEPASLVMLGVGLGAVVLLDVRNRWKSRAAA
jgi:hypothetical protein